MYPNKKQLQITLDLECYDDLDVENIDWKEVLRLEGDEYVHCNIRDIEYHY
mgnify:FL=1